MIQQTLARLLPLADASDVWVVTNHWLAKTIAEQVPNVSTKRILSELIARNTAPDCALTAFLLEKSDPNIILGVFPSDQSWSIPNASAKSFAPA
jgi:mannose-1-phosphate guanylyltransferase